MLERVHLKRQIGRYDSAMREQLRDRYYGHSGYFNFGYWTEDTKDQAEASHALVEKLLSFIPEKTGTILDVACGLGASTRDLLQYYKPEDVTAINISEVQLERARENAPGVNFIQMDAAYLRFPDASFDNILCVEAIFHFRTRERFLREAHRVLKPGGRLITSDVVGKRYPIHPRANRLRSIDALRQLYEKTNYTQIEIIEATDQCWWPFVRSLRAWPDKEYKAGRMTLRQYLYARMFVTLFPWFMNRLGQHYVLTSARKPTALR